MERQKRSTVVNKKAITNVHSSKYEMNERKSESGGGRRSRKRRNSTGNSGTGSLEKEDSCEDEVTTLEVGCDTSDALVFKSQCAFSSVTSGI